MAETIGAIIGIVFILALCAPIPLAIWAVFKNQLRVDLTKSSWPASFVGGYPQAYGLIVDNPGFL